MKVLKEDIQKKTPAELLAKVLRERSDEPEVTEDKLEVTELSTESGRKYYDISTEDGEEYLVADHDAARELAEADVRETYADLGLESFAPDYKDYVLTNFVNDDPFWDAMHESNETYVDDIKSEGSDEYESRFVEELVERGIASKDDLEENDEWIFVLKDGLEDEMTDKFVQELDESEDAVQWFMDNFGEEEFRDFAKRNNALDIDKVVKDVIDTDGIAHFIASYDGTELELDDDMYAYRIN